MSGYYIRLYKASDYHTVRDIFARGIVEHTGAGCRHTLTLPRIWMPSVVVMGLPLLIAGSLLTSILAGTIILGLIYYINRRPNSLYVSFSLRDDMLDIQKYYLQCEDRCFWVAESDREIVGMVAAAPFLHNGGEKQMELKRLSVPRRHRGKGIGKALCRTVIDFARRRGYKAVVLNTPVLKTSSFYLYEKMGFRKSYYFYPDYFGTRYMDIEYVIYQYDIQE
ncbi:probable N-acetyltransferase camello [Dendropsophus ebraccatus]|uniref:probable N-acetyltransferase camello n=1 Tax=Dendropsophus ebraccatus TaxID=150705 RepID=UPI00383220C9